MPVKEQEILLGYEVPSGKPVRLDPMHLIICGMTGESGKTTALSALLSRCRRTVIFFPTKLGERTEKGAAVFKDSVEIAPFYKARSDWQYIESMLEATMRENQRFNRAFIRKVCQGTTTPQEVWDNVKKELKKVREDSFVWSIYYNLDAYFELTLPYLSQIAFTQELILEEGKINIMNLESIAGMQGLSEESITALQSLVIRATLDEVYRSHPNTVIGLPEAWQFIVAGKAVTPVNDIAETIVRKGRNRGIFLWMDSQDLASIHTRVRGQISTFVLGKQTYEHERERTLNLIPLDKKLRPTENDVQTLKLGEFFVVSKQLKGGKKCYVRPWWLDEKIAKEIAIGSLSSESKKVKEVYQRIIEKHGKEEEKLEKEEIQKLGKEKKELETLLQESDLQISKLNTQLVSTEASYKSIVGALKKQIESLEKKFEESQTARQVPTSAFMSSPPTKKVMIVDSQADQASIHPASTTWQGPVPDVLIHADRIKGLIDVTDKPREFTTDQVDGKIMRIMFEQVDPERTGKGAGWKEIREIGQKIYGYNITDSGGNRKTRDGLVSEGSLYKEGSTSDATYFLPEQVEYRIRKAKKQQEEPTVA